MMRLTAMLLAWLAATGPAFGYFGDGEPAAPEPGWFERLALAVGQWQRAFHQDLGQAMQAAGDGDRLWPVLGVAAFAFLYGVFHAVGPGHGKAVVAGYFVGRGAPAWRAASLGGAIALVQAAAAILLVGGLALALGMAGTRLLAEVSLLEMASYGLIVVLGLLMLYRGIRGEPCCREAGHDHSHAHAPAPRSIWPAALAVGIRPCSGALIVLLFASANQAYLLGVGAVLAMALGVAITISAIGIGAIGARRGITRMTAGRPGLAARSQTALAVGGAAIVVAAGALMLLGASTRVGFPA
jgi:ABC-type nickel/cobalt efflux system permease component RcnA